MTQPNHINDIISEIDAELNRPPVDLETALGEAVLAKRMTAQEATDCLNAYNRVFYKGMYETYDDGATPSTLDKLDGSM